MDVIRVLLSFMEKRLHQVGGGTTVALAQVFQATVVTMFLLSTLVRGDQLPSVIQAMPPTSWSSQTFLPEKYVETTFQNLAKYSFFRSLCESS